ncbi:MAG: chromate transporter [Prevotellaceae bacterium]|nr:chromate transporter [Candidatus Colivivens caballi]
MIFLRLFLVFSKIGIFNFGGGYAMLSLIHNEIVEKNHWLSPAEFTDIVAISQSTPGPIGINCATYAGYTAVLNDGYPQWAAVIGAILASLSVLWLPFLLMLTISKLLLRYSKSTVVTTMFSVLRPAIVGLIAAAAILLMSADNFGSPTTDTFKFITSVLLALFAFFGTIKYKVHPIVIIILCGIAGLLIY